VVRVEAARAAAVGSRTSWASSRRCSTPRRSRVTRGLPAPSPRRRSSLCYASPTLCDAYSTSSRWRASPESRAGECAPWSRPPNLGTSPTASSSRIDERIAAGDLSWVALDACKAQSQTTTLITSSSVGDRCGPERPAVGADSDTVALQDAPRDVRFAGGRWAAEPAGAQAEGLWARPSPCMWSDRPPPWRPSAAAAGSAWEIGAISVPACRERARPPGWPSSRRRTGRSPSRSCHGAHPRPPRVPDPGHGGPAPPGDRPPEPNAPARGARGTH
jgi:hypothetical protein